MRLFCTCNKTIFNRIGSWLISSYWLVSPLWLWKKHELVHQQDQTLRIHIVRWCKLINLNKKTHKIYIYIYIYTCYSQVWTCHVAMMIMQQVVHLNTWIFLSFFLLGQGLVTTCILLVTGKNLYIVVVGRWWQISLSYFLSASLKDLPFLT